MFDYASKFNAGLKYHAFLDNHGSEAHRRRWVSVYNELELASAQRELLTGFKRPMKVLCLAGAWCGDCVNQCPIFERFAEATPAVDIRYFDRDAHADLAGELKICGGARVPVVVFLAEDSELIGWYGDRTLAKYRQLARDQLGPSCPTGIGAPDKTLLAAVIQDWLNEFERVQLLLRLSSRLRQKHGD